MKKIFVSAILMISILFNDSVFSNTPHNQDPGKATLISPSAATGDRTPTFEWHEDVNATWYRLYVSNSSKAQVHAQWYDASAVCSGGIALLPLHLN